MVLVQMEYKAGEVIGNIDALAVLIFRNPEGDVRLRQLHTSDQKTNGLIAVAQLEREYTLTGYRACACSSITQDDGSALKNKPMVD